MFWWFLKIKSVFPWPDKGLKLINNLIIVTDSFFKSYVISSLIKIGRYSYRTNSVTKDKIFFQIECFQNLLFQILQTNKYAEWICFNFRNVLMKFHHLTKFQHQEKLVGTDWSLLSFPSHTYTHCFSLIFTYILYHYIKI